MQQCLLTSREVLELDITCHCRVSSRVCFPSCLHHPLLDLPYLPSPPVHYLGALRPPQLLWLLSTLEALLHVALRVLVLHRHAIAKRKRVRRVPAHESGARGHCIRRHDGTATVDVVEEQPARVFIKRELAAGPSIYRT